MAYTPRPSQTRHGQRVDRPAVSSSDTARLRVLVEDALAENQHDQAKINREILDRLAALHAWHVAVEKDEERHPRADRRDIRYLWGALAFLVATVGALIGVLYDMIRTLAARP